MVTSEGKYSHLTIYLQIYVYTNGKMYGPTQRTRVWLVCKLGSIFQKWRIHFLWQCPATVKHWILSPNMPVSKIHAKKWDLKSAHHIVIYFPSFPNAVSKQTVSLLTQKTFILMQIPNVFNRVSTWGVSRFVRLYWDEISSWNNYGEIPVSKSLGSEPPLD